MCYFLYGGLNDDINKNDLEKVKSNTFKFNIASHNILIKALEDENWDYRITQNHCDCGTAIGSHKTGKSELKDLIQYLKALKTVRNIKCAYLCKKWASDEIKNEKIVHINEIDTTHFLAKLDENCLYKIELYKKYY